MFFERCTFQNDVQLWFFFSKESIFFYNIEFIDNTYPSNPNLCTIVALNTGPIGRKKNYH